ncbi:hypothetical protein H6G89_33060 [Oscillatoria sp. FACHB-1407]|uniref:hypothetical protein n=1 Tax=Oscillatoria sp. FACHB-1407 TaxID=2692847 RepID=UPI00168782FA|nr:hypothetical protein [Oscillatoria sp. FACHB-1407]MBD2465820.1 hypothetical protein [Oscillatoria sp. FACHB-1407]
MVTVVLADVALGPIASNPAIPLLVSLGLLVAIVVVEGVILWAFRRKSWGRSLLHALIMNLVSTVLGFVLAAFYFFLLNQILESAPPALQLSVFLLATWATSVLLEGLVLLGLKWENRAKTWQAVAVANLLSYVLLGLFMVGSLGALNL